jgi:hypothetical protein
MNRKALYLLAFVLVISLLTGCGGGTEEKHSDQNAPEQQSLAEHCERANSDNAKTIEEAFFHGEARALVISSVEPNKLGVGGAEFRVKCNPVGEGCFVYDPRTEFNGVKRSLVWWVRDDTTAYALNGPSQMVTPGLKFPREELGIKYASITGLVIDYVFNNKELIEWPDAEVTILPEGDSYTMKEYEIYDFVINASMPEEDAVKEMAKLYEMSVEEVKEIAEKVMSILYENNWMGMSLEELLKRASDYTGP